MEQEFDIRIVNLSQKSFVTLRDPQVDMSQPASAVLVVCSVLVQLFALLLLIVKVHNQDMAASQQPSELSQGGEIVVQDSTPTAKPCALACGAMAKPGRDVLGVFPPGTLCAGCRCKRRRQRAKQGEVQDGAFPHASPLH